MAQDKSLVVVDGKEIQNMIYTILLPHVEVDEARDPSGRGLF